MEVIHLPNTERIRNEVLSHPDSSLDRPHDPAMRNTLIRFVTPGTQRRDEAHMVRRDVSFTHSATDEGHNSEHHNGNEYRTAVTRQARVTAKFFVDHSVYKMCG